MFIMKNIFVSSTFRDMQAERDEIQKNITPQLRALARAYGEDIRFCDLRWGVNTAELDSEEGAKKVLSVCLDEIDKCKPYILVLLGERYGWIPDGKLLLNAARRKHFELHELEKSVTALEIEYGALNNPEALKKTIFMFREPLPEADSVYKGEDAEHTARLEALKNRIRKLAGNRVFSYRVQWDREKNRPVALEQFSEIVTEQLRRLLENDWKAYAELSDAEREYRKHWGWVESKAAQFAGRQKLLAECKALEHQNRSLLLNGDAGNGKSTLCARLIAGYREQGWFVVPFVCGNGGEENSGLDALKYLVNLLEERLAGAQREQYQREISMMCNVTPEASMEADWSAWIIRLEMLLRKYYGPQETQVLFAVIGAEKLEQDEMTKRFKYIPELKSRNLHILVSCDSSCDTEGFVGEKLTVPELCPDEKRALIHGMMSSFSKEIDQEVIDEIIRKGRSGKPLYLSLLVQGLLTFDQSDYAIIAHGGNDMAAISRYQRQFVQDMPDDEMELSQFIFGRLEQDGNMAFIRSVIEYIAASRFGLRELDLEQLLTRQNISWNSLEFSRLVNFISDFFVERNGLFDFASTALKSAFCGRIDLYRRREELFLYITTLPLGDSLLASEIVHYCRIFDKQELLVNYILICMDAVEQKQLSPDVLRKAAKSLLVEDECLWFMQVIRSLGREERSKVLLLYDFLVNYIMDACRSKIGNELAAAGILCKDLAAKALEFKQEDAFWHIGVKLFFQHCQILLKRRYLTVARDLLVKLCKEAFFLQATHEKIEYTYLFANCLHWAGKACAEAGDQEEAKKQFFSAGSVFRDLITESGDVRIALDLCMAQYEGALCLWQQNQVLEAEPPCLSVIGLFRELDALHIPQLQASVEHLNAYKNACEMLSYIHDCKGDTPAQDALALESEIKHLELRLEDIMWNPIVLQEYVRSLRKFASLCEKVGHTIGAMHDYVLSTNMLRWAVENGGGSPCIIDHYKSCHELGDFYLRLGSKWNNQALQYYLEELLYRRQILREYPFLGNAIMFNELCMRIGQLFVEADDLWPAYEAFRQAVFCFETVKDRSRMDSLVKSFTEQGEKNMAFLITMLQPWQYTGEELEEHQRRAAELLGEGTVLRW